MQYVTAVTGHVSSGREDQHTLSHMHFSNLSATGNRTMPYNIVVKLFISMSLSMLKTKTDSLFKQEKNYI